MLAAFGKRLLELAIIFPSSLCDEATPCCSEKNVGPCWCRGGIEVEARTCPRRGMEQGGDHFSRSLTTLTGGPMTKHTAEQKCEGDIATAPTQGGDEAVLGPQPTSQLPGVLPRGSDTAQPAESGTNTGAASQATPL